MVGPSGEAERQRCAAACSVSANTAFATAGAIGAVAGSPMPPICAPARDDVHRDLRHLVHAAAPVVVEVALLHAAVASSVSLPWSAGAEPEGDRALHLRLDRRAG